MADSPLNNSWPSLSKLWMKRWSFKRGSEYKPRAPVCNSAPGVGWTITLSPPSISEDVLSSMIEEKGNSYWDSKYKDPEFEGGSSSEDISGLESSLRDTEFYRDLDAADSVSTSPGSQLTVHSSPVATDRRSPSLFFGPAADGPPCQGSWSWEELALSMSPESRHSSSSVPSPTSQRRAEGMETDTSTFPILVRSMSMSRRHSWEVPLSPVEPGRRLSLDTAAMDRDEERELDLHQSSHLHQPMFHPECSSDSVQEPVWPTEAPSNSKPNQKQVESERSLYSMTEFLASERPVVVLVTRALETSMQAAREAGDEQDAEQKLLSVEAQSHMLVVQTVLQELKQYHGAKQRAACKEDKESLGDVTWYEFLSNENDDEDDRVEKVGCGNKKVKRTLSSLKNRVTVSFNKDKGKTKEKEKVKGKEKEVKEKEKESSNGHHLVPGTFSSCASCSLCSKPLQRKQGLQCQNCAVNVHKTCKALLAECNSRKRCKDTPYRATGIVQSAVQYYNQVLGDPYAAIDGPSGSQRAPGMTIIPQGQSSQAASNSSNNSGLIPADMDETDALRLRPPSEDSLSLASSTADSIVLEDAHYATVGAELECDSQHLEAESWSTAVDSQYLKQHPKKAVKRQDVIYELMQTEAHHVRTLKIMLRVYAHKMRETLQMDERKVERIFPRVEHLLELHRHFLLCLKERRCESLEPGSERNYCIQRLGDLLVTQFSGEMGERMKENYGDFCSHHNEAVNYYKEQMQNSKKFQNLIRKISNLPIVRRLGVQECILLVTQRITKYPVLLERILQNTEAGTEEHAELEQALASIKEVLAQVNSHVNDHEKALRLWDIASKLEPKSMGRIKDGRVLSKEDLAQGRCTLLHEGTVNWKAASGRLKDVLAVLLSDVLLLLQEKDQKYAFSTVDNKPSVISLQKLIVREVAHEEKAMFLICASSDEPEMYEIHTASKEERGTWMRLIRQAVESCPHVEEELVAEQEEFVIKDFQERLSEKDALIRQSLMEKLQIFADFAQKTAGLEDAGSRTRLLLRGDTSDLQQGESLLNGAIAEVESLQDLLLSGRRDAEPQTEGDQSSGGTPKRADTFGGFDSTPTIIEKTDVKGAAHEEGGRARERSQRAHSDPQLKEIGMSEGLEQLATDVPRTSTGSKWSHSCSETEFLDRVLMLSQRLYSLQAIITQQDSHIGLRQVSPVGREQAGRPRGATLLEQEKQRNLERQREEMASFQRVQAQQRQEHARWERERQRQQQEAEVGAARLREREDECRGLEARLDDERRELELQRHKYQQDLERLRESTRAVERDKEWLEQQKRLRKHKGVQGAAATDPALEVPLSSSFNGDFRQSSAGDELVPGASHHVRSLSGAGSDYPERCEGLPRRESNPSLPAKTEVPIHLISTTNQQHKQSSVQQQIPTKLAALSKGKEKGGRGKSSQRADSTVSVDMKQMLPFRLSGKEDGSLRAKGSGGLHHLLHTDPIGPLDSATDTPPPYVTSGHRSVGQNNLLPPQTLADDGNKEDVIFF